MQKKILKLLNKVLRKLTVYVNKLNTRFADDLSVEGSLYRIVDKFQVGKVAHTIKENTIEKVRPYEIYGVIKNIGFDVEYPSIHLLEYENVRFFAESDFIIQNNTVIWDKRNYPMFSKMIPQDKELLWYNEKEIRIADEKDIIHFTQAFSMCGVHATVWSHFLVQYLPKLYFFAQFAQKNQEQITLIFPEYTDAHVLDIVNYYSGKISNIQSYTLKANEAAHCQKLYYIESTSMISDHENYETYIDFFVPECVTGFLRNVFVPDCIQRFKIKDLGQNNKLYVVRKNASYRNLHNINEVEAFFKEKGYLFVEPHLLSMQEKIELFYNAKEVAGPYSAGFSNIQFCRPGATICLLSNIQRSFETYLSYFVDQNNIKFVALTGVDFENNSHSDYQIPLEKVKNAYDAIFKK